MPTYTYRCKACSHQFEEWQKMSDDPLVQCPSCKQNTLVRLIGGAGLIFKGSGFYLTDYKKNESKSKEKVRQESQQEKKLPAADKKPDATADEKSTKTEKKSTTSQSED